MWQALYRTHYYGPWSVIYHGECEQTARRAYSEALLKQVPVDTTYQLIAGHELVHRTTVRAKPHHIE